jgi:L-amino acid N-acyltransferase YncA
MFETMTLTIRPSQPDDVPAIAAIYAHHVLNGTASFEEIAPDAAEMARRRESVLERGLPYLVAEDGGEILGYAYAGPYRLRTAYRYTLEDSVYVKAGLGRRGVGRALMEHLLADCTAWGARQMFAVIGDSGNAGSIGLHAALGFEPVGTMRSVGLKFGRWLDCVLMQKPLGEGDRTIPAA